MAAKVMLIRHAEKPSEDGRIRGVNKDGSPDPDDLSVRGWQRAGALVRFFAPQNRSFTNLALATPDVIFACAPNGHANSERSKHTVQALAESLNKSVDLRFEKGDSSELARAAAAIPGIVLIAWEHNTIPEIAADIAGNVSTCPKKWADSRFDLVWVLDRQTNAGWKFVEVPQMVLPGDQGELMREHLAAGRTA